MERRIAELKFSLGSMLFFVSLIAIRIAFLSHQYQRREVATKIEYQAAWDSATKNKQCLLLIGSKWDLDARNFRETYRKWAKWSDKNGYQPLEIYLESPQDMPNDPWGICLELFSNGEAPTSARELFGFGNVVWVENGKLVDSAHVSEFLALDESDCLDRLRDRTIKLFGPKNAK